MKKVFKTRRTISQKVNGRLPRWRARSTAAQSTTELKERGRAAVLDATMAVQDAQISIAESKALAARYGIGHRGRR